MRILFVTGEYPVMQGGVGDYTRRLSQALGALRIDVHVLTHVNAGGDHLRLPATAYEPVVHPILERVDWPLWGAVARMVANLHPDVVHIQYQSAAYALHPAVNYLPWRLHLLRKRPCIATTFHDLRFPYLFPKAGPLRWQAVLALARGSDVNVITNLVDWERMVAVGLAPRLHPIPIGSNIACQPPRDFDRAKQRARWGVGPGEWLLAYFGFLNPNKGGETLVRALAELVRSGWPAHLLMVGGQVGSSDPANAAYLAYIQRLIGKLDLESRVHWTGFIAAEEVSANLLAADCAVLPYREGASLRHGSLMAALAHGLPIVSTELPRIALAGPIPFPVLHDRESALLVPPDDPIRLAAAVVEVMNDHALRRRLAEAARTLAQQFQWDTIAHHHLEMYQSVARLSNRKQVG